MRAAYAQPYVYRSKLKWYIMHPEQIEAPQLHKSRWWWRASVSHVDGVRFVGNGNHRSIQAQGASHRRGVEHFFATASNPKLRKASRKARSKNQEKPTRYKAAC